MSVLKVIEIMGSSTTGWEDATIKAVATASKSVKGIKSAWVKDQSVTIKGGNVKEFRVTLKLTFEVK